MSIKNFLLSFLTTSNFTYLNRRGYLAKKFGDDIIYSNGSCAWYSKTIKEIPSWKFKKIINGELKMFKNDPIKYKLILQDRAWGWSDSEQLETIDINLVIDEYLKFFDEFMRVFDSPKPCIHVYRGKARVGIYNDIFINKEFVKNELEFLCCVN